MRALNKSVIEEFRANGGVVGGPLAGKPMLLLTTTGARSGQARTTPLAYVPDGEDLVVFASNLGAPRDPDWFRNLVACPDVTVEVGTERFAARAAPAVGTERERLYELFVSRNPGTEGHQAKAGRPIPVVVLRRGVGKFKAWVDGVTEDADQFAYRYIYAAYLWARSGGDHVGQYMTVAVLADGGYVLRYSDLELRLADEGERLAFADYLVARYCRDKYPDMAAWEAQQDKWYVEDHLDW